MTRFTPEIIVAPEFDAETEALIEERCLAFDAKRSSSPDLDALMVANGWTTRAMVLGFFTRAALEQATE